MGWLSRVFGRLAKDRRGLAEINNLLVLIITIPIALMMAAVLLPSALTTIADANMTSVDAGVALMVTAVLPIVGVAAIIIALLKVVF